ncbi:MAG: NifB/NifX family molybdenum-iron cluster-binding protein [Candidatus Brockarchaeota archaeon]|nr:NifB/NifX family molybdenum-iron cluster-binding protein [Candidatus Brockarchaeota archaeon]
MRKLRIAIPTEEEKGLDDVVAEVFGRAKTITIVDTLDGEVKDVKVLQNPAASYRFGAGPILVKTLSDMKVEVVIAGELGPGASALIEDQKMARVTVKPGIRVKEAIMVAQTQLG